MKAFTANIFNKAPTNKAPNVVDSMIFQLPTPVIIKENAPSNMAKVDVSPIDPGIKPQKGIPNIVVDYSV
jgi:hypothetical protein